MGKYKRKPAVVEAIQWFRNGDHPADESKPIDSPSGHGSSMTEGKVVRLFRRTHIPGDRVCPQCGNIMHRHGLIDGLNGEEEIVHPGDYIVTHTKGHFYRRSAQEFEDIFERYDPDASTESEEKVDLLDLVARVKALEEVLQ